MSLDQDVLLMLREKLIDVQLALSSQHNTVTTDALDAQEDETHWRINNIQHIKTVEDIANILGINLCSSPRCSDDSNLL